MQHIYRYGPGTGPILLTQVQCDDDTNHILRCRVRGSSSLTSQCNHENDVGVICCKLCLCTVGIKGDSTMKHDCIGLATGVPTAVVICAFLHNYEF